MGQRATQKIFICPTFPPLAYISYHLWAWSQCRHLFTFRWYTAKASILWSIGLLLNLQ